MSEETEDVPIPVVPIPVVLGATITDRTLNRLLTWAGKRGYTIDEAILVLLAHWAVDHETENF